jgi:cell division protein FtsB
LDNLTAENERQKRAMEKLRLDNEIMEQEVGKLRG